LNIHRRGNVQSHNRNVKIYRTLQEAGWWKATVAPDQI
jgi:hypothetical protein